MTDRPVVFDDGDRLSLVCHQSPVVNYPEEMHSTYQICIPLQGAAYSVTSHSETGDTRSRHFGFRDILIVPAGQPHAVNWRRRAHVVSIYFSQRFLQEAIGMDQIQIQDALAIQDPLVTMAAAELVNQSTTGLPLTAALAEALATIVVCRVAQASYMKGASRGKSLVLPLGAIAVDRLESFVDGNLDKPISVATLAKLADLSMWHFMRRFEARYGMSPHVFVTLRRLTRAQQLLVGTKLSIAEIALEVGLTQGNLSRCFVRYFGITPNQFRQLRSV